MSGNGVQQHGWPLKQVLSSHTSTKLNITHTWHGPVLLQATTSRGLGNSCHFQEGRHNQRNHWMPKEHTLQVRVDACRAC